MPTRTGDSRPPHPPAPAIHTAEIYCEQCGRETTHRILRLAPTSGGAPTTLQGVARCRTCHLVHPFRSEAGRTVEVAVVVSEGATSSRHLLRLPSDRRLQVGSAVPGRDHWIRKIEDRARRSVPEAPARDVATLWVTPGGAARVPLAIVEGRRTRSGFLDLPPEATLVVGETVTFEGRTYAIRALRSLGRTVHGPGASAPARLVTRLYAGATVSPPGGSSDWSRDRETEADRASSTSRSARSRSSPGEMRNSTRPRARRA